MGRCARLGNRRSSPTGANHLARFAAVLSGKASCLHRRQANIISPILQNTQEVTHLTELGIELSNTTDPNLIHLATNARTKMLQGCRCVGLRT